MEVSSHALDQGRTRTALQRGGVYQSLEDHLDYHKTMDEYFAAKSRLFTGLRAGPSGRMPAGGHQP